MNKYTITQWPPAPADWPQERRKEFAANIGNGQVGTCLVSQSDRVRVWHLVLVPGQRIGFHTHVLDYFWTALNAGQGRSHYGDGQVADVSYEPGDTKHHVFSQGKYMIHDLENIGDTDLVFTTVEFFDSPNAPLKLPGSVLAAMSVPHRWVSDSDSPMDRRC